MPARSPEVVFLDTQVFDSAGFNLDSKNFAALTKHLESKRLKLLLTDITRSEIASRIEKNVRKDVEAHDKLKKSARVIHKSADPKIAPIFDDLDPVGISGELNSVVKAFLDKYEIETLDATEGDTKSVFEKYFAGEPPFGDASNKKSEFPDAFVIQALEQWIEDNDEDLFVVTGDELFATACAANPRIHVKDTLAALLDHVASDEDAVANFIRQKLKDAKDDIGKQAWQAFEGLGFHVIDEWGDVEVELVSISLKGEPEIIDISKDSALAEMTFEARFNAHLSFEDSDTGVWDGEEKQLLFADQVSETHRRRDELVVNVTMTIDEDDDDEFAIEDVLLIEPEKGYGISPHKNDPRRYK